MRSGRAPRGRARECVGGRSGQGSRGEIGNEALGRANPYVDIRGEMRQGRPFRFGQAGYFGQSLIERLDASRLERPGSMVDAGVAQPAEEEGIEPEPGG